MTFDEFRGYIDAFPGEYREAFAVERARIFQRFESAENASIPYQQLLRLTFHCMQKLGFKDTLTQSLVLDVTLQSALGENESAALRFQTIDNIISFRKMNERRTPKINYWSDGEPLITVQDDVKAYYLQHGHELEELVAKNWEPTI